MKFEIEIFGKDALLEAKMLSKSIQEKNLKGLHVELKEDELKEGTLSIPEYLPIIMGATVSAAVITGIFSVLTKWMDMKLKREEIRSNEKIANDKKKNFELVFVWNRSKISDDENLDKSLILDNLDDFVKL